MPALALYRLPYAEQATMLKGEAEELLSCHDLNGKKGFVFAPFKITPDQPILLIKPCESSLIPLFPSRSSDDTLTRVFSESGHRYSEPEPDYIADFTSFHDELLKGDFQKLVLSRCAIEYSVRQHDFMELFQQACRYYPRMFVSVVLTGKGGLWLTATPELLLEGTGDRWHTLALAGTMKLNGDQLRSGRFTDGILDSELVWSDKNIREQHLVATYISDCLSHFAIDVEEKGPRTVRAANLAHLCSDFTFNLPDGNHVGDLLQELYPTPAVCGIPKRQALDFILRHEHTSRGYYSGFLGGLGLESGTHLYVNLRCMEIRRSACHLFAGGGLLSDSILEQEWQETEAKLQTMRVLLKVE